MKREIVWTWAAEADLLSHYSRFEDMRAGRGDQLLRELDAAGDLLCQFPLMAPIWNGRVRRLVIQRAHLGLFYSPEAGRVVVLAVADLRQDPKTLWREIQGRLPK